MTVPASCPAGPPALPRRPGRCTSADLRAAWADYITAIGVESLAWELTATQAALGRGGFTPVYAAAAAQAELAWQRYLQLAQAHKNGE